MADPTLHWDFGTAYDLFVSLTVLHDPARFSVRAAWAAGQRQRLPTQHRDFLEQVYDLNMLPPPLNWLHNLPDPKDGVTVLWALEQLPPADRLPALALTPGIPPEARAVLHRVADRGMCTGDDAADLHAAYKRLTLPTPTRRQIPAVLDWWTRLAEFGDRLLAALTAYHANFFAEEEQRIEPLLQQGHAEARMLAARLPFDRLLENLSHGVRFEVLPTVSSFVLAPSFWGSPLIFHGATDDDRYLILFGARPFNASIVPGEVVPDALLLALKAMGDPTRLRILRYLSRGALTPTDLADRLRLRTSTVAHHLNTLRMAGLIRVTVTGGRERLYATRDEQIEAVHTGLNAFLSSADDWEG